MLISKFRIKCNFFLNLFELIVLFFVISCFVKHFGLHKMCFTNKVIIIIIITNNNVIQSILGIFQFHSTAWISISGSKRYCMGLALPEANEKELWTIINEVGVAEPSSPQHCLQSLWLASVMELSLLAAAEGFLSGRDRQAGDTEVAARRGETQDTGILSVRMYFGRHRSETFSSNGFSLSKDKRLAWHRKKRLFVWE